MGCQGKNGGSEDEHNTSECVTAEDVTDDSDSEADSDGVEELPSELEDVPGRKRRDALRHLMHEGPMPPGMHDGGAGDQTNTSAYTPACVDVVPIELTPAGGRAKGAATTDERRMMGAKDEQQVSGGTHEGVQAHTLAQAPAVPANAADSPIASCPAIQEGVVRTSPSSSTVEQALKEKSSAMSKGNANNASDANNSTGNAVGAGVSLFSDPETEDLQNVRMDISVCVNVYLYSHKHAYTHTYTSPYMATCRHNDMHRKIDVYVGIPM